MHAWLVDLLLGFSIGLSLGLLGGGGSILTVPALVYLVGQDPQSAVTTSLAIVGANSAMGAAFHRRHGSLDAPVALVFGSAGMLASYLAAGLSRSLPPAALMVAFAFLMILVGGLMLTSRVSNERGEKEPGQRNWLVVAGGGAGVGLLTGILGVGGGFLIVPVLVMLVGLPIGQAVGTSLVVIAANSLAGLLGHLQDGALDLPLTALFIAAGFLGALVGSQWSHRLPAARLRQAFALFVIALAIFLLFDNLPRLLAG